MNDKDEWARNEEFIAIMARIRDGRRSGNGCLCDWCKKEKATDPHEIFPRALTKADSYERDLCYSHYVLSLLCRNCHTQHQNSADVNRELLSSNRKLWGKGAVNTHIMEMHDSGINISFQDRVILREGWMDDE